MLSKCANPECSEILRYLREGKLFYLAPTPDVQIATGKLYPSLQERFWLCDRCAKEMTLTWEGTKVKVVPLAIRAGQVNAVPARVADNPLKRRRPRVRAASAGRDDK